MANEYKNIPVKPEVYDQVRLISEANGLGERGLGAQIAKWAARELPECTHKKTPVQIEYFTGADMLPGQREFKNALYCSTCKRVYVLVDAAQS
jgi:hypothetical protein